MSGSVSRREFLKYLGAGVAGLAVGAGIGYVAAPPRVKIKEVIKEVPATPKPVPEEPLKIGVVTILTGPGAMLMEPGLNALKMEVEKINAAGGILGRKIELSVKDSGGKPDKFVEHMRRLIEEEEVEYVIGGCTSAEAVAAAPIAEELKTIFLIEEGTTSELFEKIDPHPKYVFRINNYDPLDFTSNAVKTAELWPDVTRVATIGADYTWGRDEIAGFLTVYRKLNPAAEVITQTWPPLFSKDYTDHITTLIDAKPDLVVVALWGGDLVTFLTQATGLGLFDIAHATCITGGEYIWKAMGVADGVLADARYYYLYPPWDRWSLNKEFCEEFKKKFPESRGGIPGFNCNSSYVAIHALKIAIEKAYAITGGWPDTEDVISALENLMVPSPGGYRYFRKEDHQMLGYAVVGLTSTPPGAEFPILDPIWPVVPEVMAPPPGVRWKDWVESWP